MRISDSVNMNKQLVQYMYILVTNKAKVGHICEIAISIIVFFCQKDCHMGFLNHIFVNQLPLKVLPSKTVSNSAWFQMESVTKSRVRVRLLSFSDPPT